MVERVRQEVFEVVGRDRKPEHGDIKKLKFMKQVINKTLRLYPTVPFNVKSSLEDSVLSNGRFIPKGSLISEDAEEFDPYRWGPERVKTIRPFMFFPFHAGSRIYLGQSFAYYQAVDTMSRLIQRYTWTALEGFESKLDTDTTMPSRNGIQI
ncbi:hypothetical protein BG011_006697 [Mortierella polycephala]|uniref:Cytochrome P450 n=1 Tax=Mortierella polycephala TaxID=41804 RepID=A0A9P6PS27_9FUNG|nr:hypothetical protein BG011_006697 [Mortierella polycephala]